LEGLWASIMFSGAAPMTRAELGAAAAAATHSLASINGKANGSAINRSLSHFRAFLLVGGEKYIDADM